MRGRRCGLAVVLALLGVLCLFPTSPAGAQTFTEYLIDHYAGPPEGVTLARGAETNAPFALVVATDGTWYVADLNNHRVLKVTPNGVVSRVAGVQPKGSSPSGGFFGDGGPATSARLNNPFSLALDHSETHLYIADRVNHRIRRVDFRTGIITTVAGTGTASFSGDDGAATAAQLNNPTAVAVATDGTLYLADWTNQRIRKVAPDGTITTIAGTGTAGFGGDGGPATAAEFDFPTDLALNLHETTLYVADFNNNRIRAIDLTASPPTISTVWGDGQASTLDRPRGVAVDYNGALYVTEQFGHRVQKRTADGTVTTIAGTGTACRTGLIPCGDGGPATAAELNRPAGIAVAPTGTVYIADLSNHRVRTIGTDGIIRTVLGTGKGGHATREEVFCDSLPLNRVGFVTNRIKGHPKEAGLALAPDGTLYWGTLGHVCKLPPGGPATVVAGQTDGWLSHIANTGDDGPATEATFAKIVALALSPDGRSLYIGTPNHIRAVDLTAQPPQVRAVAQTAGTHISISSLAVGADSTMYMGAGNQLHAVNPRTGTGTAIAGGGSTDLAPGERTTDPTSIRLSGAASGEAIESLAIASDNTLYFATARDRNFGSLLYRLSPDRTTLTRLETHLVGASVNGLAVSRDGKTLYATDNNEWAGQTTGPVVRAIDLTTVPHGVRIIAGHFGVASNSGDGGLALHARLVDPTQIVIGPDGRLYVMDIGNARIRVLRRITLTGGGTRPPPPPRTTGGGGGSGSGGGGGGGSRIVEVRPTGPTRVRARADGPTRIALTWTGPRSLYGEAVTSYELEVSEAPDIWTTLEPYLETPSYTHTALRPATTYAYRVYAHNAAGRSLASAVARATTADPPALTGVLDVPRPHAMQSGVGVLHGWVCEADDVHFEINGTRYRAAYGTARADTRDACGDTDNGFGLLFNWNELGDGTHEVVTLVDGVELGRASVTVTTLGEPFLREASGTCEAVDFPTAGEQVTLVWQEARQNFVLTDGRPPPTGASAVESAVPGFLENPAPNSFQSGIGLLSGWVCAAETVTLEIAGQTVAASYGTERADTQAACGDTDNGFGVVVNWSEYGAGDYAVIARADGVVFDRATVRVTTLGTAWLEDAVGTCEAVDFPAPGETVRLTWQEAQQNFVITAVE